MNENTHSGSPGAFEIVTLERPNLPIASVHTLAQRSEFHQIAPVLEAFMRVYPKPLEVPCPRHLVPATVANRIRKGAKALLLHEWQVSFDLASFKEAWKGICIRETAAGTLVIGPRSAKLSAEEPISYTAEAAQGQKRGVARQIVECPQEDPQRTLTSLVWLHHSGAFVEATHLKGLPEEVGIELESKVNGQQMGDANFLNISFRRHPSEPGWLLF